MIERSRYLAFVFILVLIIPGVSAPPSLNTFESRNVPPTAADLSPLDQPIQTSQDFEGNLNQSIIIPVNDSLVPFRVDVNATNLNRTSNRLQNGDFSSGISNWQGPNIPGKTIEVNESGPQGARALEVNFTGIWNTTHNYPLNASYQMDQFDDPGLWILTPGVNVTTTIDNDAAVGGSGNYLSIAWWENRPDFTPPHIGNDSGTAMRYFLYNGTDQVNSAIIKFDYRVDFAINKTYLNPHGNIKCNVTITNPSAISRTFENAVDISDTGAYGTWVRNVTLTPGLGSIFGEYGEYTLTFSASINQWNIGTDPDNIESRLLIDNVYLDVNSSIGYFATNESTNITQSVPLSQLPLNDTKVTVSYCASIVPDRINHPNMQLGFFINQTWFNLSALSDLSPNVWVVKSIWVAKENFTGSPVNFKLGLRSFNASELFPNETLLVYFTNVTMEVSSLATGAELNLNLQVATKNAPFTILSDAVGNFNASIDYGSLGGFGLGTTIRFQVNSTFPGGIQGKVTVFSWTWREALWRSLNNSMNVLEAYIENLPNTYASLFSNTPINFTHINFARALAAEDYYLARTYATQVGPDALFTTSVVNTSVRLLWPALGQASFESGVPDRVSTYLYEIFDAQQNPHSLVSFLKSDPRWGWVQANATLAPTAIHDILAVAPVNVPTYINASTLIEWASTLQVSINSCIAGASWIIPEPAWGNDKTQIYTIGYCKMAASNLIRPIRPAFPILTTATQFVGGAPLLATLVQSTNGTANWNYLTPEEFRFCAYFDAIVGYLAESTSLSLFLQSIPTFVSEGIDTPASRYQYEKDPKIDISFTSDHLGSPELAISTSWQGNASITSGWIINTLYALSPNAPVLLWEQAIPIEDIEGTYTRSIQWRPPMLPPALNELYVDTWEENWIAPIALRTAVWVGGREISVNLSIQQEISEKWFNISEFSTLTAEDGSPLNVAHIDNTGQDGVWCFSTSMGLGPRLEFRESGGNRVGYNPWGEFFNDIGSDATYNETAGVLNLLYLRGALVGDFFVVPCPASNAQLSTGRIITKFSGITPHFSGIVDGTIYITPKRGETTFTLTLPVWEGTRSSAITNFAVEAQIISQTDPHISVTSTNAPSLISRASFASITLGFTCPTKPIGHQFELLLTLTGNAEGGIPINHEVQIIIEFVDVISPQPPIPDSILLAILTIVGSIAVAFIIIRWYRFLYFRRVIREEPRIFKE